MQVLSEIFEIVATGFFIGLGLGAGTALIARVLPKRSAR
jgi:hypothetical protein